MTLHDLEFFITHYMVCQQSCSIVAKR